MAFADNATTERDGLAHLPTALLHGIVELCWVQTGAPTLLALSCTCKSLLVACNVALAAQRTLMPAATVALRCAPPPGEGCAGVVMGRLLTRLQMVTVIDLSGLHFWVYDSALVVSAKQGAICHCGMRAP
jgi:hypothetical protein